MSALALIYTYLSTPDLTGVADRVFPHYLPYAERQPYADDQVAISYEVTGRNPVEDKYRPAGVDILRLQVNCYGRYLEKCETALDELRAYLDMRAHETVEAAIANKEITVHKASWAGTSSPALSLTSTLDQVKEVFHIQRIRWKDTRSLYDDQARLAGRQDEYELRIINR